MATDPPVEMITVNGQWMPQGSLGHEMALQLRDALKELAQAQAALSRVREVRQGWVEGWEPVHHKGYIADLDRALASEPTPAAEPHAKDGACRICYAVRPGTLGYQQCVLPAGHEHDHHSQDGGEWHGPCDVPVAEPKAEKRAQDLEREILHPAPVADPSGNEGSGG